MKSLHQSYKPIYRISGNSLHLDYLLLSLIFILISFGLVILYSASNENPAMMMRQAMRLSFAVSITLIFALIPPYRYKVWTPWLYIIAMLLLIAVMVMGKIGKGAQRWLDLGFFRFQPSEIMKLAVPMMVAWYLEDKKPPFDWKILSVAVAIFAIPTLLITKQPDLGTSIIVACAGASVVFLAGLSTRILIFIGCSIVGSAPVLWHILHDYQRQRILTLLNPEKDPLGNGYHIIQSKIAIGSGGLSGKGWLNGSQSHLNFLPEHATDFIFAVCGEEFGFLGSVILITVILLITLRCFQISQNAQTSYAKLLSGSLAITFFISSFVNIGMVMGILPVVGIPLPLVSYGGTAMVTFLASFGILMSISTHRVLFNRQL